MRSLVLASGYYYPTVRADVLLSSPMAIPGIGDLMRYTVSPVIGSVLQPAMIKAMFAPAAVTKRFDREFSKAMMLRPVQLRASAEDAALMTPVTVELENRYGDLTLPVVIIVGGDDQIADVDHRSKRLHSELPDSDLIVVPGMSHMIQHLAPKEVIAAIDRAAKPVREAA